MAKNRYYKHPTYGHVYGESLPTPLGRFCWVYLTKPKDIAEDGSKLWLRQASVCCSISSPTIAIAREELASLWRGKAVELQLFADEAHRKLGKEGYTIRTSDEKIVLGSTTEQGLLYAAYHLLRLQAEGADCTRLDIARIPSINSLCDSLIIISFNQFESTLLQSIQVKYCCSQMIQNQKPVNIHPILPHLFCNYIL